MPKLENMAADEFKKLPKKKQKEINKAKVTLQDVLQISVFVITAFRLKK